MYSPDTTIREAMGGMASRIKPFCRATIRCQKWQDETLRQLFNRPVQSAITESAYLVLGAECDDELKELIEAYLERANHRG